MLLALAPGCWGVGWGGGLALPLTYCDLGKFNLSEPQFPSQDKIVLLRNVVRLKQDDVSKVLTAGLAHSRWH